MSDIDMREPWTSCEVRDVDEGHNSDSNNISNKDWHQQQQEKKWSYGEDDEGAGSAKKGIRNDKFFKN